MIKDELKKAEPIVYQTINNAFSNNKVAHSYLLSGEYSPLKIDTAYLIAQSIIESNNALACETCNTCQRIKNNNHFDVIYVDGYKESIKKEAIENILDEFSRTSLESSGKKVYILANINNASTKVLNMILKFMEEPSSENIYGIFISDKIEDLLPTIVSRCQNLPFKTRDFSYVINSYVSKGFDYADAYLLSHILHNYDDNFDLNDEYYLNGKEYVYKTIETLSNVKFLPIMFSRELYTCMSDRDDFKKLIDYYLKIMIKMLEDAAINIKIDDNDYNNHLNILRQYDVSKLLEIFIEANDKLLNNAERKLLFDDISFKIISVI